MHSTPAAVPAIPKHFHSLDALRGLAALAVVFWHWQHFSFHGTEAPSQSANQQPLHGIFAPLYANGWRAVDLFFCLSGFIFFWLYRDKISARRTTAGEFFILRFSRLYPLHVLTLLVVAAGQQFMLWRHGSYFVYPDNDAFHFSLQAMFASNWGFERGQSFNGPIWSVSVEVLCYILFFLVCRLKATHWGWLVVFVGCGYYLQGLGFSFVGRGVLSFFAGGLAFLAFGWMARRGMSRAARRLLGGGVVLLWVLVPLNMAGNVLYEVYRAHLWTERLAIHGKDVLGAVILTVSAFSFELLLFPATLVALALWEMHRGTLGRRLAVLGHISYSSYLWHFPLQMVFMVAALALSTEGRFFSTPWSLLLFFAVLIPWSLGSYLFFERPCQSRIRRWALKPAGGASGVVAHGAR